MTNAANGVPVFNQAGSIANFANGAYTGDGSGAIVMPVGFTPRYVKVIDITDVTQWEFIEGMPANNTLKTVGGAAGVPAITVDTTGLIVTNGTQVTVTEVEFGGNGAGDGVNGTQSIIEVYDNLGVPQLTFATGLNTSAKVYVWEAFG